MMSVRWPFGFLNRLRKQKRRIDGVAQRNGCRNVALQMRNNGSAIYDGLSVRNVTCNYESYANHPVQEGQAGDAVKINDVQRGLGHNNVLTANSQYAGLCNSASRSANNLTALISGHKTILLFINEAGEAYDLSGRKWSRAT